MADGEVRRSRSAASASWAGPWRRTWRVPASSSPSTRARTRRPRRFAAEHGARAAASPREAAEGASAVITMVPDAPEVEEVLLGEQGAVHGLDDGASRSTCPPSPPPRPAPSASGSTTTASPSSTPPSQAPAPRPRTARSRSWSAASGATSSAPGRSSRRWESASSTWARAATAQLVKLLTNTMGAVHAAALAEGARGGAGRARPRTPSSRWPPGRRRTRPCSA